VASVTTELKEKEPGSHMDSAEIHVEPCSGLAEGCRVVVHDKERLEVREIVSIAVDGDTMKLKLDEPLVNKYKAKETFVTQSSCDQEKESGLSSVELAVRHARNKMYAEGRKGCGICSKIYETVLFTRILDPMLAHGSATIYAPDLTIGHLLTMLKDLRRNKQHASKDKHIAERAKGWIKEHLVLCIAIPAAGVLFMLKSKALTCFFKTTFIGWAIFNRGLDPGMRFLSISGMMILRLAVSNVLPFTSPAFAFLIATSQPPGEDYMGVVYLLACSMPAGLVVPFFDWLLYWGRRAVRWSEAEQAADAGYDFGKGARQFDHHFIFTGWCTKMTDYLPFSFWVRPFFMQPAFSATITAGAETKSASAVAVLAGHFMIWAGPATSMYQRLFVPDWVTCCFIQPLGLLEDVAVVLAEWAGSAPGNEKAAEVSLYVFMLYMNLVAFYTSWIAKGRPDNNKELIQHLLVGLMTVLLAVWRHVAEKENTIVHLVLPDQSSTTQTTTALAVDAGDACGPTVHSNVKVAGALLAWVSFLAVAMRLVARAVTRDFEGMRFEQRMRAATCESPTKKKSKTSLTMKAEMESFEQDSHGSSVAEEDPYATVKAIGYRLVLLASVLCLLGGLALVGSGEA